ncbi:MAG: hypothetical protein ACRDN6_06855 [Gaiellaceae bacterium]
MAPESVVHALRRIHRSLAPEGILLDLRSIPPHEAVEADGVQLGRMDESAFFARADASVAELESLVAEGLFRHEAEVELEILDRFDTAAEALESLLARDHSRVPDELAARLREHDGPVALRARLVLKRLRRLP